MKKLITALCIATTLFAASCKKSDDSSNNNTNTSKGSWQVGSTTYTAKSVSSSLSGGIYELIASSDTLGINLSTINFIFQSGKPSTGVYRVVGISDTAANTVYISASYGGVAGGTYHSTGNDRVYATVTVNGNSISITNPAATATSFSATDSLKISATGISLLP